MILKFWRKLDTLLKMIIVAVPIFDMAIAMWYFYGYPLWLMLIIANAVQGYLNVHVLF